MCRFPSVIIVSFAQSLAFLLSVSVRVGRSTHSGKPKSLIISRKKLLIDAMETWERDSQHSFELEGHMPTGLKLLRSVDLHEHQR